MLIRVTTFLIVLLAWTHPSPAQPITSPLPPLPDRHDTLTVAHAGSVIGRGILTWTRQGLEQLQVYVWTSAADGSTVTDSLFSDPASLVPVREVRVIGDTVVTVIFGGDTLFLTTVVAGAAVTSRAVAPEGELYSSASIESLAATMLFRRGTSRTFLTFYAPPSQLGAQPIEVRVVGREILDGRAVWRITASTPGGGTTYWVDAVTRTVLQSETREGGAVITFRP